MADVPIALVLIVGSVLTILAGCGIVLFNNNDTRSPR